MHIYKYQKKGFQREKCNDAVLCTKNGERIFAGIADGAGNRDHALNGAMIALDAAEKYMKDQNLAVFLDGYLDQRQFDILTAIRCALKITACKEGCRMEEFASTICALSCDTQTGDFILMNLGDGVVLGGKSGKDYCMISGAENHFTQNHTYLTTVDGAASHIRLGKGNLDIFTAVILMTDGAWRVLRKNARIKEILHLVSERNYSKLDNELSEMNFIDDASIVVLSI